MVKCPRCEQLVDETERTTCPLCFTSVVPDPNLTTPVNSINPLQAAQIGQQSQQTQQVQPVSLSAQDIPPPRPGSTTAGGRVTLMGDIIPDDPAAGGQSFTGSNVQELKDPRAALSSQNFEEAETSNKRGTLISGILFFLVVFGGGGYYWWYGHRTNPQDQAKKYFQAVKVLDYKTMYETTSFSDEEKKSVADADAYTVQAKGKFAVLGTEERAKEGLKGLTIVSVGEPKTSDKGVTTVKVKMKLPFGKQSLPLEKDVEMKNEGGLWKVVNASTGNNLFGGN